jgi:YebC/PmpR family DNA-binding regulatory protein
MSGHSKWSTIKRKKGAADAKKGKIFTKLVREITISARIGGGDPSGNPRLRAAIAAAKAASMPSDNIDRAIKKGTGELEGSTIEEAAYEGYGPGGVAFYIETQTDNRNRTTSEVRNVFTKSDHDLGKAGSVSYQFHKEGRFVFDGAKYGEEELMEAALEAGADDVVNEGDNFVVTCDPKSFGAVADHFDKQEMGYDEGDLTMVPDSTVKVAGDDAEKVLRFLEKLEDLDDVQKVYANFDIDEEELERIAGTG